MLSKENFLYFSLENIESLLRALVRYDWCDNCDIIFSVAHTQCSIKIHRTQNFGFSDLSEETFGISELGERTCSFLLARKLCSSNFSKCLSVKWLKSDQVINAVSYTCNAGPEPKRLELALMALQSRIPFNRDCLVDPWRMNDHYDFHGLQNQFFLKKAWRIHHCAKSKTHFVQLYSIDVIGPWRRENSGKKDMCIKRQSAKHNWGRIESGNLEEAISPALAEAAEGGSALVVAEGGSALVVVAHLEVDAVENAAEERIHRIVTRVGALELLVGAKKWDAYM